MSVKQPPKIVLVGLPNSGKSTLFNRMTHSSRAIISDIAHTTRDTNRKTATIKNTTAECIDTAGFTKPNGQISEATMHQLKQALMQADVIVYVVDSTVETGSVDAKLARLVRDIQKPVVVAANKSDNTTHSLSQDRFRRLGFEHIVLLSAIHGDGYDELIESISTFLPSTSQAKKVYVPDIKVAIMGRPNVGKSSLLNALAGENLAIEADEAGTTRDTNEFSLKYKKTAITFVDTAGLRRPGKIAKSENIEFYSKVRTKKAVENADICLLLIDANDLVTAQDQHLLGMLKDAVKGLIIVVTKWDAIDKDTYTMPVFTEKIRSKLQFVWWAPVVFTSAKDKQNLSQLLALITELNNRLDFTLSTPKLNRFLEDANAKNPPSAVKTKKPKVNYITQTGVRPPKFTLFSTHPEYMHWSYTRYLENQFREQFDLNGVPVTIEYKSKYKEGNRDRYKKK